MKEEDPAKYEAYCQRMRQWFLDHYHGDPSYREHIIQRSRNYRAEKSKDPEWRRRRSEYERERQKRKRLERLEQSAALATAGDGEPATT